MSANFFRPSVRQCLLALAFLICSFPASARKQGQELIDSLLRALPAVRADTTRVDMLCRIGNEYSYIDPDAGLQYATQALEKASAKDWNQGIANACNILGICELYKGNYAATKQYWERALDIYRKAGDKHGILKVVGNTGALNTSQGDYAKALDNYFEALKSAEDLADQNSIAINLGNIGVAYNYLQNNKKALEYYEKAVALFVSLGDKQSAAIFLADIGHVYREEKAPAQALRYADSAMKLSEAIGDNENVTRALIDIGKVYNEQRDYAPALDYSYRALSLATKNAFASMEAGVLTELGEIFLKVAIDSTHFVTNMARISAAHPDLPNTQAGLIHTAVAHFQRSIAIDSGNASLDQLRTIYSDLSQAFALLGQYREALSAYRHATILKDSIFSTESKLKVTNLESQRELALKDKQIEIDRLAVAKKRNERMLFGAGFVLLLIAAGFVVRNIRLSTAKELSENKLNALQARMNPHFIFNSLSSIQSLILNDEKEQSMDYLSEFSILMRQILDSSGQSKVSLKTEIDMLRSYVELEHLRFDGFERNINVAADINEEAIEVPGMVVQPFVENAILHGLISKGNAGKLDITFERRDKHIICTVEDNGVGRTASAEINAKRARKRQSHGTSIATNRLTMLNDKKRGLVNNVTYIDKAEGGISVGTKVIIELPIL